MKSRDFCYWFQGYLEIENPKAGLSPEKLELVKRHLNMVFAHEIDPSFGTDQEKLKKIHDEVPDDEDETDPEEQLPEEQIRPHRRNPFGSGSERLMC